MISKPKFRFQYPLFSVLLPLIFFGIILSGCQQKKEKRQKEVPDILSLVKRIDNLSQNNPHLTSEQRKQIQLIDYLLINYVRPNGISWMLDFNSEDLLIGDLFSQKEGNVVLEITSIYDSNIFQYPKEFIYKDNLLMRINDPNDPQRPKIFEYENKNIVKISEKSLTLPITYRSRNKVEHSGGDPITKIENRKYINNLLVFKSFHDIPKDPGRTDPVTGLQIDNKPIESFRYDTVCYYTEKGTGNLVVRYQGFKNYLLFFEKQKISYILTYNPQRGSFGNRFSKDILDTENHLLPIDTSNIDGILKFYQEFGRMKIDYFYRIYGSDSKIEFWRSYNITYDQNYNIEEVIYVQPRGGKVYSSKSTLFKYEYFHGKLIDLLVYEVEDYLDQKGNSIEYKLIKEVKLLSPR